MASPNQPWAQKWPKRDLERGRREQGEECEKLFVEVVSGHVSTSGNSHSGGSGCGVLPDRRAGTQAQGRQAAWWTVCGVLSLQEPQKENGLFQSAPVDSSKSFC